MYITREVNIGIIMLPSTSIYTKFEALDTIRLLIISIFTSYLNDGIRVGMLGESVRPQSTEGRLHCAGGAVGQLVPMRCRAWLG